MFPILLLIFVIVPLLELLVIIEVSSRIGLLETIVILILISAAGAALAKREGYNAVSRIRAEMARGRMPGDPLIEGAVILAGAVLLLTPGFITDALGLMLLLPLTRRAALGFARRRMRQAVDSGRVTVWTSGGDGGGRDAEQYRRELED